MKIRMLSERSLTIVWDDQMLSGAPERPLAAAQWLRVHPCPGQVAVVPALASLTVWFDQVVLHTSGSPLSPSEMVKSWLEENLPAQPTLTSPDTNPVEIGVHYTGPDLPEVAAALGLKVSEVIRLHTAPLYSVQMIGFLPGFPYLGFLPDDLILPRKKTPVLRVPPGSVAIAGKYSGIYPQSSPGGWHLIGHTAFTLFSPEKEPPATLQPGARVQFFAL